MWLAIALIFSAFGMALASALIPVIAIEVYLLGLVLKAPDLPWWLVAAAAAIGQISGKMLYFHAGRGTIRLPRWLRRKPKPPGRWSQWAARVRQGSEQRPIWTAGVLLASAFASVPPYALVVVTAGVARVPVRTFLTTGLLGRFGRFGLLAAAPALCAGWLV